MLDSGSVGKASNEDEKCLVVILVVTHVGKNRMPGCVVCVLSVRRIMRILIIALL